MAEHAHCRFEASFRTFVQTFFLQFGHLILPIGTILSLVSEKNNSEMNISTARFRVDLDSCYYILKVGAFEILEASNCAFVCRISNTQPLQHTFYFLFWATWDYLRAVREIYFNLSKAFFHSLHVKEVQREQQNYYMKK